MKPRRTKVISFTVPGIPIPQPRARRSATGGVYTPDNGIVGWKAQVRERCARALYRRRRGDPYPARNVAFAVSIEFVFSRPKSHFKRDKLTKHELVASAPPEHMATPDLDNLVKASLDALGAVRKGKLYCQPIIWHDDAQVVEVNASKRYATTDEEPHMAMTVWRLER